MYSGAYSFSELSVNVFITLYVPWLLWLKTFIISLLGEFGRWVLELPMLVIAPLKFIEARLLVCGLIRSQKKCLLSQFQYSTILAKVVALSWLENKYFFILVDGCKGVEWCETTIPYCLGHRCSAVLVLAALGSAGLPGGLS